MLIKFSLQVVYHEKRNSSLTEKKCFTIYWITLPIPSKNIVLTPTNLKIIHKKRRDGKEGKFETEYHRETIPSLLHFFCHCFSVVLNLLSQCEQSQGVYLHSVTEARTVLLLGATWQVFVSVCSVCFKKYKKKLNTSGSSVTSEYQYNNTKQNQAAYILVQRYQ